MGTMKWWKGLAMAVVFGALLSACEVNNYESGDGKYSYLRADFGMIHTSKMGLADYVLTDEGRTVAFESPATVKWTKKADSLYRALVYYDASTSKFFSASQVMVVIPQSYKEGETVTTDPLTIESVWTGGGYLNIGFSVKAGQTENIEARQHIGLVHDSTTVSMDGKKTVHLRIVHAQNGIPEYYSVRGYMSMPLPSGLQGASISLSANTYKGTFVRRITL